MGAQVRVVGQKFLAKLNNGENYDIDITTDFATHLKGGVLEEVKAIFNIQINWDMAISKYIYVYDSGAGTLKIVDDGADWTGSGFSVGDLVKFTIFSNQTSPQSGTVHGDITSITDGEIIMNNITVISGGLESGVHLIDGADDYVTGLTDKTALKFDFGLIENSEPINFLSKLTNTKQTYLYEGIGLRPSPEDPRGTDFVAGKYFGNNKAAHTGSSQVKFVGLSLDNDYLRNEQNTQEFEIEHIFTINPIYEDGQIDALKGIDVEPLLYKGDASLKYVFNSEFRTVLNNPNTSMSADYDTQLGSVGYLDEAYNGFESVYSVEDLVYTLVGNAVDRLGVGEDIIVTATIKSSTGTFSSLTPVIIGHTAIVDSLSYTNSKDDYDTVWSNENLRVAPNAGVESGDIIKGLIAVFIDANTIDVNFRVDLTDPSLILKLEENQDYLLYFTVQDESKTVDTGDKVTGRIDVNYYSKNTDVAGLMDFTKFEQYPHPEVFDDGVSVGFTEALTFNESGMMADGRFWIDNDATLNNLKFDIAVYKFSDDTWDSLRSLVIDLSDQVIVNGIQQIELDSTRGYVLIEDDIFNYLKVTTDNNDGTKQFYNIQVGYKMPWQSWIELKNAPTDFYDKTKSHNGLNQKSSNYSLNPNALGYGIKVLFDAVVDETNYVTTSEQIKVYDYHEDDNEVTEFLCEINTYKLDPNDPNGQDVVEIANNVIQDGYTQLKALFTPVVPPVFSSKVNMSDVATVYDPITDPLGWIRFAHGNQIDSPATSSPRIPNWFNQQADDVDSFAAFGGAGRVNKNTVTYTSDEDSITTTANMFANYGMYSTKKYEFYEISGTMFSTDTSDNDTLIYNVAFMTDEFGVEHTLSLCATCGGVGHLLSPGYIAGNAQTSSIAIGGNQQNAGWDLVYDMGKGSCVNLFHYETAELGFDWGDAQVGDLFFNCKRSGDQVLIDVDWTINGTNYGIGQTIDYDLNTITVIDFGNGDFPNGSSQALTTKFKGFQAIGFSYLSQASGGFKDVVLVEPGAEYYSILRIAPKDAQSDFTAHELSSIIEAPKGTLLKQITGSEKLATLEYDFINEKFICSCLIETELVEQGQNYDFSTELRLRNLEKL